MTKTKQSKQTTNDLIERGREIDKAINVTQNVSWGELAEYDAIIQELNKRGIIPDETIEGIANGEGEVGDFDMYLDENLNICHRCNKVETDQDTEEFINNIYDDLVYCHKCCEIVTKEFEAEGWTYNDNDNFIVSPDGTKFNI